MARFGQGFQEDDEREDALVAAMVALHRRGRQEAQKQEPRSSYGRVIAHFERRAERQRGERIVTEELIERLLQGGQSLPPVAQRELEIRGPAGGLARGRVQLRSSSLKRQSFELTTGSPISGSHVPEVRLDPQSGVLAEGAQLWLLIEANLAAFAPGDRAVIPVHCHFDAGIDRIWLVVSADPGQQGGQ